VALEFMMSKETKLLDSRHLNPLWMEYQAMDTTVFYFNPFTGELSLELPAVQHCTGGILADDMGLGKTIEILALIHSNRLLQENSKAEIKSTLIICPLNVLAQWRNEIHKFFPKKKTMTVEFYYGDLRENSALKLLSKNPPDIVLTTYGTLGYEFSKSGSHKCPLYNVHWFRIVLDEAHFIKDRVSRAAKACYALKATNRWAVTGTPIINKLEYFFKK
jgi:DNA repair protein RAD5